MLITAAALPRAPATRAVLLMPLVWAGLPTIGGLQMGNFQVMTLAISMAGMAMFSRRHDAAGGALLGFAVVGKLFPGMLLLYLAARRAWRPVVATCLGGLLIVLLALWDMGLAPFAAFVHHLPRLLGGRPSPRSGILRPWQPTSPFPGSCSSFGSSVFRMWVSVARSWWAGSTR